MVHINYGSPDIDRWSNKVLLSSKEDVSTLLHAYESCIKSYNPKDIHSVVERNGFYAFIVNPGEDGNFDLFEFINSKYAHGNRVEVNCANARFLFPEVLSRGEYSEDRVVQMYPVDDAEDEAPTGFLDEDDILERHYLVHVATGTELIVEDEDGVIIGRSRSNSNYAVNNIMLSRRHARVYLKDGKYMVEDFGSQNGTFIDRLKVMPGRDKEIRVGDILKLADEKFQLV